MSLSVVKRPQDFYLSTTENADNPVFNSSGALINKVGHGLSTGNYVYITEGPSQMLGFWYVEILNADNFYIREYATADRVQSYVTSDTATYYQAFTGTYAFLSVHNPIVYKLASTLWPTNAADTARTVSSFSNYNGYTALNLSGDIKATGNASALEQVIIDGTTSLDGVYTILNWFNDSSIVIDLAYSASHSFGGTVQYYYYNYHARIRIYAGLSPTWTSQIDKPIELVAELRAVPSPTGIITVNVNEVVKEKVSILTNDSAKQALPNFYEGYTALYIEYAESYNDSNGYTVEEFVSSYTSDSANPVFATNGKLPFKNRNFGFVQYICTNSATLRGKWMTDFAEPVLTPGKYFDLGIIFTNAPTQIKKTVYVDGVAQQEYFTSISGLAFGMQRFSVEQSGWGEDRIDVVILNGSDEVSETISIQVDNDCSNQDFYLTWLNRFGVFAYWNFKARKVYSVNVEGGRTQEKNIFPNWPSSYGEFADTIRQQTSRETRNSVRVESQHLTQDEIDAIKWIISSPLVQIVTSKYDRRTVIVDGASVRLYRDQDKLYNIGFTISYTDELPSQSL